jgi:nucleotide-binding universal stress UspA family protein
MGSSKRILVGVDFSEFSSPVVQYAANLAVDTKATLILVNIINERDIKAVERVLENFDADLYRRHLEGLIEERRTQMDALVNGLKLSDKLAHFVVRFGVPYQELLRVIDEEHPAMLVLGAKGRSNFVDALIGSTTRKMSRRCPVPLVIIPQAYVTAI